MTNFLPVTVAPKILGVRAGVGVAGPPPPPLYASPGGGVELSAHTHGHATSVQRENWAGVYLVLLVEVWVYKYA